MDEIELQEQAEQVAELAEIIVDCPESYERASEVVLEIDGAMKRVKGFFRDIKAQAHAAWRGICDKESEFLSPLEGARKDLAKKISDYATEQERQRRIEQARLEQEAQRRAAEEKARLEAAAAQAREAGHAEFAEALEEQALTPIVPEIVSPTIEKTAKVSGGSVTQKKDLDIEVTDLRAFLAALLAEKNFPAELVAVQGAKVKTWAKLHGLREFPGLRIRETVAASFRRAG